MTPFLITGLPRSRTAWLSVVADGVPGATCEHEPLKRFKHWSDIGTLWRDGDAVYVGASDSGLALFLSEILARWSPRTLIVCRSAWAVDQSLRKIGIPPASGLLELMMDSLSRCLGHPMVRTIEYDDLTDPDRVVDALAHLMPGARINLARVARLQDMNIQCDLETTLRAAANADAATLLGRT